MSLAVTLPVLGPIAPMIQDPDVTRIMVNGSRRGLIRRHDWLVIGRVAAASESEPRTSTHSGRGDICLLS
jgi:Flp pilus assembly CpaF family ATPase